MNEIAAMMVLLSILLMTFADLLSAKPLQFRLFPNSWAGRIWHGLRDIDRE